MTRVKIGNTIKKFWNKNSRKILAFAAGGSTVMAVVSAINAGPKLKESVKKRKEELEVLEARRATKSYKEENYKKDRLVIEGEFVKETAVTLGPTIIFTAAALGANASGYRMGAAKEALLSAAYLSKDAALTELKEKTKEVVGNGKFEKIQDEIVKDHVYENPPDESMRRTEPITDAKGNEISIDSDYPCFDVWSGKYFRANRTKIEKALLSVSARAKRAEDGIVMADIYDALGTRCGEIASDYGFSDKDMMDNNWEIPYRFTSCLDDIYGPVLALVIEPNLLP